MVRGGGPEICRAYARRRDLCEEFFFPVVAKGKARIRVQISAGHERHHLDKAIEAFIKVGKELGVLKAATA